jgi:integrase
MIYEYKHLKKVELSNGRVGISFFYNNKRFRYFNGSSIEMNLNPNTCESHMKQNQLDMLLSAFTEKLNKGWRPIENKTNLPKKKEPLLNEILKIAYDYKQQLEYSERYKKDLTYFYNKAMVFISNNKLEKLLLKDFDASIIKEMLNHISKSKRVQLNSKRNLSSLLSEYFVKYNLPNPFQRVKLVKQEEVLHKPIKEIRLVLDEIYSYNTNLHLCCLLAYGCLLRPHREIRNLMWSNFSDDCTFISLSGAQNKGKKNRIVPVPLFIRSFLIKGKPSNNIFTGLPESYNEDYFKTLWSKFKKSSKLLNKDNTLYSFRHTGAINVFEKTGSITKLQQVMGHSNLNVSLTYLRGLEIKQLEIQDMPEL